MGKVFSHKYYKVNGTIWAWSDPANALLVSLFNSNIMETIEFAISSNPFQAPHVVVTHSPGEEPKYLDTHGNPDQLTDALRPLFQTLGLYTSSIIYWSNRHGPTFTPASYGHVLRTRRLCGTCAPQLINRQNIFHRVSIQFHEGLRRARVRRQQRSRSHITISNAHSEETDVEPPIRIKAVTRGFSDTDAAASLFGSWDYVPTASRRSRANGRVGDYIRESDDEEDDDDDGSISTSPHSPTIGSDTYEVLRRLGMVHCAAECDGESEASAEDCDDIESESEDEYIGDMTIPIIPHFPTIHRQSPNSTSDSLSSSESIDLASLVHTEADEQSSVSSYLVDEDSFESGSETPDTDEGDC
ncbi:hypothetical protein RhiXN_02731 [Rhizoctonia solani]|uniref:Uncharacterized protein n=1 Tax=Rhizoctonia solani TaxID=456999 RepID=A0A8H8NT92_9AGAM|nr:uncharacterized protein RhiXN_02731 [Rhizoctonia solani]QRW17807.1 hypothetical protein RhiXN_02731 [Rhizoctonia solani]